jgi:SEC-C motif
MDTQEPTVPGTGDLSQLLGELRQAGQQPSRTLLDRVKAHGQAARRPLIEMAVDEQLHHADSDRPEVWAPLHAIQLLGELGASEAIEPLLPLFNWVDDDYLAQTLPEAFGGIGAPAVGPLRVLLLDRGKNVWARVPAAESLGKICQAHPETRSAVVSALVACLDPAGSQVPEDELLNGVVISELLTLKAVEAAPAIRQAFKADRVDTSVVDLDHALEELDLPPEPSVGARLLARLRPRAVTDVRGLGSAAPRPSAPGARKVGRNDACPCGSGQKYKKCHGR